MKFYFWFKGQEKEKTLTAKKISLGFLGMGIAGITLG
jgi:hypothetical protein